MEITSAIIIIYIDRHTNKNTIERIQFVIWYGMSAKFLWCTVVLLCEYDFCVCMVFRNAQLSRLKFVSDDR